MASSAQTTTFTLHVFYRQAYLVDAYDDLPETDMFDDHPEYPVGIIRVSNGMACLITGLHSGPVSFSATVADEDPGPDLDGYEDIVEISLHSESDHLRINEWGGDSHLIPQLPAGPGWYRLRFHAVNMDEAAKVDSLAPEDAVVDRYLLQIWPQPDSSPLVLKSTSKQLSYWRKVN